MHRTTPRLLQEKKKQTCRTYALRRVRDAFRENRNVEDPKVLDQLLNKARDNLAIIQRQLRVSFAVRFGSFSSWKLHPRLILIILGDGSRFFSRISR
ncbi:LYR motif-containing protein 4 isoform X2 [Ictalurus punctatus]|uniref:LYR motif-containing protein 4 isoform X2 n=1 Tax=Ictalurus punctatus TaxID=7998 RepID=A0A979F3Q9_ICTPU|nr:LYR motif-containing protein 4 isoform X2 [Ictalurus punctatus]